MKPSERARARQRQRERTECPVHGYQRHGREAEELRAGIEAVLAEFDGVSYAKVDTVCGVLRALLDRVDARDSLAYLERRDNRGGRS